MVKYTPVRFYRQADLRFPSGQPIKRDGTFFAQGYNPDLKDQYRIANTPYWHI
jgi:hypothetical protein